MNCKRVVLFNSPYILDKKDKLEEGNIHARIGIASIAAYLLSKGIETYVIDSTDMNVIRASLKQYSADIVGIPAFTFEIGDAAATARLVKEVLPDAQIIVGGPHPTALPVETLKEFDEFDIAVIGEGERTVEELCTVSDLSNVTGIAFRNGTEIKVTRSGEIFDSLDEIPSPAWNDFDFSKRTVWVEEFNRKVPYLPVESSRGCPFPCIFCFRVTGKSVRYRDPKKVADEVERLTERFGQIKFYFVDGTFGIHKKFASELCDEFIRRSLPEKVVWDASSRVDVVDKELLIKMKNAGCIQLGFGIESGDDKMLKIMGKNFTTADVKEAIDMCLDAGIQVGGNFILGYPHETRESIKQTIKFAKKLPIDTTNFAIMVPFPGTEVREMAERNMGGLKILTNDWRYYGKQIGATLELNQLSQEDLQWYQTRAYLEFYLTPRRIIFFIKGLTFYRVWYGVRRLFKLILYVLRGEKR